MTSDYQTELDALSQRLAALNTAKEAHRSLKAKHIELLAKLAQHFPGADKWTRRATRIVDDNESNGSYPPGAQWADRSGPRLLEIHAADESYDAAEGGFYHACTVSTATSGTYVDRDGVLYGARFTGTARYGQFPAHPGYASRDIAVEWYELTEEEITYVEYDGAIAELRKLIS